MSRIILLKSRKSDHNYKQKRILSPSRGAKANGQGNGAGQNMEILFLEYSS